MRDCPWPVQTITITADWTWSHSGSGATASFSITSTLTRKPFADFIADAALQEDSSAIKLDHVRARCQNAAGFYGDNVPSLGSFIDQEPWIGALPGGGDEYYGLAEGEFVIVNDYPSGDGEHFCAPCQAFIIARFPEAFEEIGEYSIGEDTFPINGRLARYQIFQPYQSPQMLAGFARAFDWPAEMDPVTKATVNVTTIEAGDETTNAEQTIIADADGMTVAGGFAAEVTMPDGCVIRAYAGRNNIELDTEYDPEDNTAETWKVSFRPAGLDWIAGFSVVSTPEGIAEPTERDVIVTVETDGLRVQFAGRYARQEVDALTVTVNNTALGDSILDAELDYYADTGGDAFTNLGYQIETPPWTLNIPGIYSAGERCPTDYSLTSSATPEEGSESGTWDVTVTWE